MRTRTSFIAVSIASVLFASLGCETCDQCKSSSEHPGASSSARLTPRPASATFDDAVMSRLASLEGAWEMADEAGQGNTASIFHVSSNGSVVREVMFPGQPHEMTNLYHMDGKDAVVTHYCAVGNQPRMVATRVDQTDEGPSIDYEFQRVSNFRDGQGHVMGSLRLVFVDDDTLQEHWRSMDAAGNAEEEMVFVLKRKR